MKVKALMAYLEGQDPEDDIGFFDHFGEFHKLEDYQIGRRVVDILRKNKKKVVIVIEPPDFGPEPD